MTIAHDPQDNRLTRRRFAIPLVEVRLAGRLAVLLALLLAGYGCSADPSAPDSSALDGDGETRGDSDGPDPSHDASDGASSPDGTDASASDAGPDGSAVAPDASVATSKLGTQWIALGDSETAGRATGSVTSPMIAFEAIYNATGSLGASPTVSINGVGGRPLRQTAYAYHGGTNDQCTASTGDDDTSTGLASREGATWVHFQESGDQDHCGERTRKEFGDTFEALVRRIHTDSPNAVISTETAYSFEREATNYRDWTTYNDELKARVGKLAADGIVVRVADVDANVKRLVSQLGFDNVILADGGHYRGGSVTCLLPCRCTKRSATTSRRSTCPPSPRSALPTRRCA